MLGFLEWHRHVVDAILKGEMMTKEHGRKWDGRSRIPTDNYKKRYDEIFKKKTKELDDKRKVN